jgi:hypothetical protein
VETSAITSGSITIGAVTAPSNGQTVEYAIAAANTAPSAGWQDGLVFSGLIGGKAYYVFARAKGDDNHDAGTALSGGPFTTSAPPVPPTVVDFEDKNVNDPYSVTGGNGSGTATVIADPASSSEKSLKMNSTGYNRGAIIPINLPFALKNYQSFTFRYRLSTGSPTSNDFLVYVADATSKFVNYGFGNPTNHSNQNQQFGKLLLGKATVDNSSTTQWASYEITIPDTADDFDTIKELSGNIFLAVGINSGGTIDILIDDLTFNIKGDFVAASSISPATATFVKATTSSLYKDIPVDMTLYGNTFSGVKNGETTISPSSTTYTVSGNTVELKKEYLAGQAVGDLTLTFVFNQGGNSNMVIKIVATDADLLILVYDFAAATSNPGWEWIMAPDDANVGTASWSTGDGLKVALKSKNDLVVLPFRLESGTSLTDYTLYAQVAGVTGDIGYKPFNAVITTQTNKKTFTVRGNNNGSTTIASFNSFVNGTTPSSFTSQAWNSSASSAGAAEDGYIWIGFYLHEANPTGSTPSANSPTVYRILKLELRKN